MNFFGHALVASWCGRGAGFALGSMLPDFAGMCGMRLEAALDPDAAAGVDFHHATDREFHRLEPFARAVVDIAVELDRAGVARGPARGAAHVGFELCLDGALVGQDGAAQAYCDALAAGPGLEDLLSWSAADGPARWRGLCRRLAAHGPPVEYRDPDCVAERVERVLARRPLLALGAPDAALVRRAMPGVAERASRLAPVILSGLRAGLRAELRPAPPATPPADGRPGRAHSR